MFHLALCILEVLILLMIARLLYVNSCRMERGMMSDCMRLSDPGLAAAIGGNAANRNFDQSQVYFAKMGNPMPESYLHQ